jgi:hypothetical protein
MGYLKMGEFNSPNNRMHLVLIFVRTPTRLLGSPIVIPVSLAPYHPIYPPSLCCLVGPPYLVFIAASHFSVIKHAIMTAPQIRQIAISHSSYS